MSAWAFWARTSILALTIGSFAVFVWLQFDFPNIRREIVEAARSERSRRGHWGGR